MDVPVCLLAAEAEYVQALGWYDCADRLADSIDNDLQIEVLVQAEVAGDVLAVLLGSDEDVSVQRLIALKERDRPLVFVNDVVAVLRIPAEHLADEAATRESPPFDVEVHTFAPHQARIWPQGGSLRRANVLCASIWG